jgi:gas vesicle protein
MAIVGEGAVPVEDLMNEQSSYLASMLWFLAGGVAGAGLSLVLAPQSGKATRALMRSKVSVGADAARQLKDRVVGRGGAIWDEAAHRVVGAASALSGGVERTAVQKSEGPAL